MNILFQYPTGATLGYSIERLADHKFYDFADGLFRATPTTLIASLPEGTGSFAGRYAIDLLPTPQAQFSDGEYCGTIHDTASANLTVGLVGIVMFEGSDAPAPPNAVSLSSQDLADLVAGIWGRTIDGYAAAQVLGVLAAVLAGNWSKDVQGRYHFRALDGSADRVIETPGTDTRSTTIQPGA